MSTRSDPAELSLKRALRLVGRAFRLRCPHCGEGALFSSWLTMRRSCPGCRLKLDRGNDDYFIGGYLVNLLVAELIVVAGLVGVGIATWPDVPWTALTYGLALLMVPAPFVTYPYSKALWLAVDLHFQPATAEDFDAAGAPAVHAEAGR